LKSESAAAKHLKVLIVDDHPMVREGLAGILSRFEITISGVAATGQNALRMFSATRPDVTLLDLRLPDQNGLDVLKSILKLDPNARVVILTTSQADANIYDAISLGASGYLLKGIEGGQSGAADSSCSRRRKGNCTRGFGASDEAHWGEEGQRTRNRSPAPDCTRQEQQRDKPAPRYHGGHR
jgi:DNA-binding NarL/FixJ family response regulator